MIEVIIGFFLGYTFGKTIGSAASFRKPDKILSWNADCLGYRPVHPSKKAEPGEKYLICYEIQSADKEG